MNNQWALAQWKGSKAVLYNSKSRAKSEENKEMCPFEEIKFMAGIKKTCGSKQQEVRLER